MIFNCEKYNVEHITKTISWLFIALMLISCSDETDTANPPQTPDKTISGTIPALYIETENHAPIVSKTEYLNATYWLDPMGAEDITALGSKTQPLTMQIRGRGHSSWKGAKKPYKGAAA